MSQHGSWNLADLYASMEDPALEKDTASAHTYCETLQHYRGKVAQLSPTQLRKLIGVWEDLAFTLHKLDLYSSLLESTNVGDPAVTRFSKKMNETLVQLGQEVIFLDTELARLSEDQWQALLKAPELKNYQAFLQRAYSDAKHTLTEPEEKILAEKSQTSWQALSHLYQITTSSLTFPWNDSQITLDELLSKFHDPDPTVRKKTAQVLHSGLAVNDTTTPAIYNALVQDKSIHDRLRGYTFPEQARFQSDQVERETVDALAEAVEGALPLVTRYYSLKKRILGVKTLYWWDRYAPLPETKTSFSSDEAKRMVLTAFTAFSPRLASVADTMFTNGHIDWFPSSKKRGGAFCAFGGRNIYPYVLLNYDNTPNDVMTLAHELGHAAHDVLAQEGNVFFQTHPSLATAEIASTFAESLLFETLLQTDIARNDKVTLIMSEIEGNFATIFRQILMFRFEQAVHRQRREQGELSKDEIDALWQSTMERGFGQALTYTPEHANTWMYIPHIINSPFYVYSYAFAQLCTLSLYQKYKEEKEAFTSLYEKLLAVGGSRTPADTLKLAGFTLSEPDFWAKGLSVIESYVTLLEKEIQST